MKICLIVVFNHAFEANLPRLDALYAGRFSKVLYLMPFYQGDRKDVVPVFHSSHCFQGFFADALRSLQSETYDHYLFIADDLILRSDLDESTLPQALGIDSATGYIKEMLPLGTTARHWTHSLSSLRALKKNRFVEFEKLIPTRSEAERHFGKIGLAHADIPATQLWSRLFHSFRKDRKAVFVDNLIYALHHHQSGPPRLPLFAAYSDLVCLPSASLPKFSQMCGVFAAMGMFVEVAIPTALALSCQKVRIEADNTRRGHEIWNAEECAALVSAHDRSLAKLLAAMPEDLLYIHPVKLSGLQA